MSCDTTTTSPTVPHKKERLFPPYKIFSGTKVVPKIHHFHSFGCPTYVLDSVLQSGQGAPKWKSCVWLGVYLGLSPNHAHSITLVLKKDGLITLTQPQSIDSILKDLHLQHNMKTKTTPAMSTVLLHKDVDS